MKTEVKLGSVPETLLFPLLGRAELTRKGSQLIYDQRAVEIVESLDYDFSNWIGGPSLTGTVLRTRILDEWVKSFLDQHDSMKHMAKDSWFRWVCDGPRELEGWGAGLSLVRSMSLLDADAELLAAASMQWALIARRRPWLIRRKVEGYRLNEFATAGCETNASRAGVRHQ